MRNASAGCSGRCLLCVSPWQAAASYSARRACRRAVRESLQHFEGPLPCASPRCAHLPAASREPCPGRSTAPAFRSWASVDWFCFWDSPSAAKLRDAGSPLNDHRSGDQQHKKDRHQYRGYQPLTKIELGNLAYDRPFGSGGSAKLSVTDNSQGARDDIEHIVTICRIARRIAVCFRAGPDKACNATLSSHLKTAPSYRFSIPFAAARSLTTPNLVNDIDQPHVASMCASPVRATHGHRLCHGAGRAKAGTARGSPAENLIGANP